MSRLEVRVGDCIQSLKAIGNSFGQFDALITSPHYNVGCSYDSFNDREDDQVYLNRMMELFGWFADRSKPESVIWLNYGPCKHNYMLPARVLLIAEKCGFRLENHIIWVKSASTPTPSGELHSWGQFTAVTSPTKLHNGWEHIYCLVRKDRPKSHCFNFQALSVPYADQSNTTRWKHGRSRRSIGDVWCIPHVTKNKRTHPCPFPPALVENCIKLQGIKPGGWVLDPFAGECNTAVACKRHNINCLCLDLSTNYLKRGLEKWHEA